MREAIEKKEEKDENFWAIIDKLLGMELKGCPTFIRTKPSISYPRGKFYIGYLRFIDPQAKKFQMLDNKLGMVDVYYSEIASPSDIEVARDDQ